MKNQSYDQLKENQRRPTSRFFKLFYYYKAPRFYNYDQGCKKNMLAMNEKKPKQKNGINKKNIKELLILKNTIP